MAEMANELTPEQKLQNAVCLIRTYDELGNVSTGTGFHYGGGGWIMTTAHIFQDRSILSNGRFDVQFDTHRQERIIFQRRRRLSFVIRLHSEDRDQDIAMVKLGYQWEYCRKELNQWEKDEVGRLTKIAWLAAHAVRPEANVSETQYAVCYVGERPEIFQRVLHMPAGSSGCPIVVRKEGNYYLAGLHVSGDGGAQVLIPWGSSVQNYVGEKLNTIYSAVGHYMTYGKLAENFFLRLPQEKQNEREYYEKCKNNEEEALKRLEKEAREANFPIYLSDGEVVN